jgi:hypothetical protein
MRITSTERERIEAIVREEIEEANRRMLERLSQFEGRTGLSSEDARCGLRQFYQDLADKAWTDADEEALNGLADLEDAEIKRVLREAYRRSPVHPVPNFGYLINLLKKGEATSFSETQASLRNPDAVSAAERERLANLLHNELSEAVHEIGSRLHLKESNAEIVRERLSIAEGNIIARFTPLV